MPANARRRCRGAPYSHGTERRLRSFVVWDDTYRNVDSRCCLMRMSFMKNMGMSGSIANEMQKKVEAAPGPDRS
jgi:hypothetical protein